MTQAPSHCHHGNTYRGVVSDFPPLKGTGGGSLVRKISDLALIL